MTCIVSIYIAKIFRKDLKGDLNCSSCVRHIVCTNIYQTAVSGPALCISGKLHRDNLGISCLYSLVNRPNLRTGADSSAYNTDRTVFA